VCVFRTVDIAVVEPLPGIHKVQGSILSTIRKNYCFPELLNLMPALAFRTET
jgi:hypothetical protein